jgi:hypothetical protein
MGQVRKRGGMLHETPTGGNSNSPAKPKDFVERSSPVGSVVEQPYEGARWRKRAASACPSGPRIDATNDKEAPKGQHHRGAAAAGLNK